MPRNEQRAAASTSDAVTSGSGTKRRARKPSQRSPAHDGAGAGGTVGVEGAEGGPVSGSEEDVGEPSGKRMRFFEGAGSVDAQQQGTAAGPSQYGMPMDAASAQAQARAQAQAATFYMQPDGTVRRSLEFLPLSRSPSSCPRADDKPYRSQPAFTAEGDLPWPPSFGYPAARTVRLALSLLLPCPRARAAVTPRQPRPPHLALILMGSFLVQVPDLQTFYQPPQPSGSGDDSREQGAGHGE